MGQPAAAVICLSAGMDAVDAEYYVHGARGLPPVLLFAASTTCPRSRRAWRRWRPAAARAGLGMRHYRVPGKPHFYDRASAVVLKPPRCPGGEPARRSRRRWSSSWTTCWRRPR
jgi:hypothetical protein